MADTSAANMSSSSSRSLSREHTKVLIIGGGGTFGSSTALHLLRSGYTPRNITLLDVYPIPSSQSAGNDLNKIFGVWSMEEISVRLTLEAREMWVGDELFKPFFHPTGGLECSGTEEGILQLREEYEKMQKAGVGLERCTEWLDSEEDILSKAPMLDKEKIKGWKGIWNAEGAWLDAGNAINAIGQYVVQQGVQTAFGAPMFDRDDDEEGKTCIGVETVNGKRYYADKIVLAAGAWTPTLVDLKEQCCSKAWVYTHLQLTPEEAALYKGCPVVYNEDIGFFFEPTVNGVIKVCDEFPGFTRYKTHQPFGSPSPIRLSVPRSHAKHPTDTIPIASDETLKYAIETYLPRFKGKEMLNRSLCWCTDTADSKPLICEYPGWQNFYVASGDSGHSFKLLPSIGRHIVELLEGRLSEDLAEAWKWRPGQGDATKSTRAARAKDLADMPGYKHDAGPTKGEPSRCDYAE